MAARDWTRPFFNQVHLIYTPGIIPRLADSATTIHNSSTLNHNFPPPRTTHHHQSKPPHTNQTEPGNRQQTETKNNTDPDAPDIQDRHTTGKQHRRDADKRSGIPAIGFFFFSFSEVFKTPSKSARVWFDPISSSSSSSEISPQPQQQQQQNKKPERQVSVVATNECVQSCLCGVGAIDGAR